jgi:hypothetical protein
LSCFSCHIIKVKYINKNTKTKRHEMMKQKDKM